LGLVLVGLVVVLCVAVIALYAYSPLGFSLVVKDLFTTHFPPPIAQGILRGGPEPFAVEPTRSRFTAALRQAFPKGSSVLDMQKRLAAEGFEPEPLACSSGPTPVPASPDKSCGTMLVYRWGGSVCESRLEVFWRARGGRLEDVGGGYGTVCL
jgi:hypothetical protein